MAEVKEGEIVSKSPVPKKKEEKKPMGFPQAIQAVMDKKKVTRREWDDNRIYGFLNGEILSLHKEDNKNYQWIVSEGDMMAGDWIIL